MAGGIQRLECGPAPMAGILCSDGHGRGIGLAAQHASAAAAAHDRAQFCVFSVPGKPYMLTSHNLGGEISLTLLGIVENAGNVDPLLLG